MVGRPGVAARASYQVVGLTVGMSLTAAVFLTAYYMWLPVLPMHLRTLGWQKNTIGILSSVFAIASLAARPLVGVLVDRSGPSRILSMCCIFLLVPAVFGLGGSFAALSVAQAIAGLCVGACTVASNGLLAIKAPMEHMGEIQAWFSIALVSAKGFGSAFGSWLYEGMGFTWSVAVSAALVPLFFVIFKATERMVAPATGPAAKETQGAAGNNGLNARVVGLAAAILITIAVSYGGIMTFLPIMAKERDLPGYGYFFVIQTMVVILVRTVSGRVVDRAGAFWVILVAILSLSAGVGLLATATTFATLIGAAILYGIGYGASYPSLTAIVVMRTPASSRGRAFGLYTAAQDLGMALGQASAGLSQYASFETIYMGMAVFPLASIILLMWLFRGNGVARGGTVDEAKELL